MKVPQIPVTFRCKVCDSQFTIGQDEPFLKYLAEGMELPMKCPNCRRDRISEFLGKTE